ncbi:MAG: hypothetical protein KH354_02545 [Clostridiales bacterium]|nr:hypothetical protein [Clostridiales bacterium]
MGKIVWEGHQEWEKDFPDGQAPENTVKIKRPDNLLKASIPYGIIPLILCFACVLKKRSQCVYF